MVTLDKFLAKECMFRAKISYSTCSLDCAQPALSFLRGMKDVDEHVHNGKNENAENIAESCLSSRLPRRFPLKSQNLNIGAFRILADKIQIRSPDFEQRKHVLPPDRYPPLQKRARPICLWIHGYCTLLLMGSALKTPVSPH